MGNTETTTTHHAILPARSSDFLDEFTGESSGRFGPIGQQKSTHQLVKQHRYTPEEILCLKDLPSSKVKPECYPVDTSEQQSFWIGAKNARKSRNFFFV